jgi:signal transduction histidine kinase
MVNNVKMGKVRKISIIVLLISISILTVGQIKRTTLVGAYVYNFARYTTWQDEKSYNNFLIVLVGNDQDIINEIESFSKAKELKGKPILFEKYTALPRSLKKHTRVLVLLSDMSSYLTDILKLIGEEDILLVTDRVADKRKVMFNLYDTPKNELTFEINRANIINQGLTIDPEIILLGGTEIDVAALYRTSQKSMDTLQQRMKLMNDSLSTLKGDMQKTSGIIAMQVESIASQRQMLDAHEAIIKTDKLAIDQQKGEIAEKKKLIDQQQGLLLTQKAEITEHGIELQEQRKYIDDQLKKINQSKLILDSLKIAIDKQHSELGHRDEIIKRQRITVVMTIISGLFMLVVLVSLFKGYRNKIKKNQLLTQQKEQIEKINSKLELTNRSLYDTITKLHETQSQLVSSEKMASLGVLTAGIAHEINNPVNFIYTGINSLIKDINELFKILTDLLQKVKESGNEELIQAVKDIENTDDLNELLEIIPQTIYDIKVGAERAADIIKGLRNFSRIDRDSKQVADIHEGIDSSLLLLRNKFKNHITVKKEYKQIPHIECYPGKLNQAFMNILSNAIDAIEKEGAITIRTWSDEEQVFVQIEDTGKGISSDVIDKIFDPFFTTKSVGKGVGLGLSITYGIIQEHNGKIDVKSEQNVGTVFTISLPCNSQNMQSQL